jgi:hypothetical protein
VASWHNDFHTYIDPEQLRVRPLSDLELLEAFSMSRPSCLQREIALRDRLDRSLPKEEAEAAMRELDVAEAEAEEIEGIRTKAGAPGTAVRISADGSSKPADWPLHVDLRGLSGVEAIRHVLSLWDGDSTIVDAAAYVNDPRIGFSKAGCIMAGLSSIRTNAKDSLVLLMDVDMMVQHGYIERQLSLVVRGKRASVPICWSTCFGANPSYLMEKKRADSKKRGWWRYSGTGNVAAYLSDLLAVGGIREMVRVGKWGSEDELLYQKLRKKFKIVRERTHSLIHLHHAKPPTRDWSRNKDGMASDARLGLLNKYVCKPSIWCSCPDGTELNEIRKRILGLVPNSGIVVPTSKPQPKTKKKTVLRKKASARD